MFKTRNQNGTVNAMYETRGTRTEGRKSNGVLFGSYDTQDNITRKSNGVFVSYGNTLACLVG